MKNIFLILSLVAIVFTSCYKEDNNGVTTASTTLSGANVVPSATTSATAKMDYSYNSNTKTFTYKIDYSNLTDSCTQFGVAFASSGQAVPTSILQLFSFNSPTSLQRRKTGTFTGQFVVEGQAVNLNDLRNGKYCVFLRTKAYTSGSGEVRGQIAF